MTSKALRRGDGVPAPPPRPSVVLGLSDAEPEAHRVAWEFARSEAHRRGLPIRLVHGCGFAGPSRLADWIEAEQLRARRRRVTRAAQQLRQASPGTVIETVCSREAAVGALLSAASPGSLVVLQTRPGRERSLTGIGSTVDRVAARAACPVAVLHGDQPWRPDGAVVVGVAERGRTQAAVWIAMAEAARTGVPVVAVHVWEVPMNVRTTGYVPASDDELELAARRAEQILADALAGASAAFPMVQLRREVVRGPVVDVLRQVARDASLLVVARHASSHLAFHALGRTARALLHDAPCPLMLTPPGTRQPTGGRGRSSDLPVVRTAPSP